VNKLTLINRYRQRIDPHDQGSHEQKLGFWLSWRRWINFHA